MAHGLRTTPGLQLGREVTLPARGLCRRGQNRATHRLLLLLLLLLRRTVPLLVLLPLPRFLVQLR